MSRRKSIDPAILQASQRFDAQVFADTVRGEFADFPDHRRQGRVIYPVWYLALVVLCGFFCGCNTIEEVAEYASLQREWLASLCGQSRASPSHTVLWWFLVKSSPGALKQYFQKWFVKVPDQLRNQLLAIDGKRLKGAKFMDNKTHVVELFAADDRLCLAMEKVPSKTVEKSTLPIILEQVDVRGAIISADAHFTLEESAKLITEAGADYLLAVKANQPTLLGEMENYFDQAHAINWDGVPHSVHKAITKDHGRIESREIHVVQDVEWLPNRLKWAGLTSLIDVRTQQLGDTAGKFQRRMYISSCLATARAFAKWTQQHWSIENNCHWVADVIFEEDFAVADQGHAAENLALFRRLAMNMAAIADPDRGLSSVRRAAAFGPGYLKGVLAMIFCQGAIK